MPLWNKFNNSESVSPTMDQLMFFNDITMMTIILISFIVFSMTYWTITNKISTAFLMNNQMTEILWTILPSVTLFFIAIPSLKIIYLMEELNSPSITIKSIGHQWYWTYEYADLLKNNEFDSYMLSSNNLNKKDFRLLDVDNRMVMPMLTSTRIIISSTDVLHSWTVPPLGIKVDAMPGRLNQMIINIKKPGTYFGQCSEICGANHSFMPIVIEVINTKSFINWLKNFN